MVLRGEHGTVQPNSVIVQEKHADYHTPGDSLGHTSLPIRRRATCILVFKPFTVGIRDDGPREKLTMDLGLLLASESRRLKRQLVSVLGRTFERIRMARMKLETKEDQSCFQKRSAMHIYQTCSLHSPQKLGRISNTAT